VETSEPDSSKCSPFVKSVARPVKAGIQRNLGEKEKEGIKRKEGHA
jgi:hypothetical protein